MADFGPINASPSPLVFRNSPVPVSPSPLTTCGEARAGDTVHYCSSLFHEGILFFRCIYTPAWTSFTTAHHIVGSTVFGPGRVLRSHCSFVNTRHQPPHGYACLLERSYFLPRRADGCIYLYNRSDVWLASGSRHTHTEPYPYRPTVPHTTFATQKSYVLYVLEQRGNIFTGV
jgi:hypothetical protein